MSNKEKNKKDSVSSTKIKGQGIASRKLALEVLIKIESKKAYANLALSAAFKRKRLVERDRAFVTALVQGVTRQRLALDEQIAALSTEPLDKMPVSLRNILRMAIFQLNFMSGIPASAVVDTSTELAKTVGHQGLARFTNGLLRNYLREREVGQKTDDTISGDRLRTWAKEKDSSQPEQEIKPSRLLAKQYSMPGWLVERWLHNYGEAETKSLLEYAQKLPDLVLRTCELAITPDGLQEMLLSRGIACHRGSLVPSCIILDSKKERPHHVSRRAFRGPPEKLPGYKEGLFSIQDEAAAFVSIVTDPQPGELIIDLCAAPGGKSLHLGELMKNTGRVIAIDRHESRLNLLRENRSRLGLKNIETMVADARQLSLPQLANRVLVDAPCTGTGVINRRTDLRYRKEPVDLVALTDLQRELLANAAYLVKPGGILVYSTCSIEPEENFDNIRWFLKEHNNFVGDDISRFLPRNFFTEKIEQWEGPSCKTEVEMNRPSMLQLLPSRHHISGFFIARLKRCD